MCSSEKGVGDQAPVKTSMSGLGRSGFAAGWGWMDWEGWACELRLNFGPWG